MMGGRDLNSPFLKNDFIHSLYIPKKDKVQCTKPQDSKLSKIELHYKILSKKPKCLMKFNR